MRMFHGIAVSAFLVLACGSSAPDFTPDPNAAPATSPTPSAANTTNYPITVGATTGVKPGAQVGYSITALAPNSYRVVWTGDAAVSATGYHYFSGSMWASGHITGVIGGCANSACPLEAGDNVSGVTSNGTNDEVTWDTDASIGFDGFDFTTDGGEVFFDTFIDSVRRPDLVYIPTSGGQVTSPTTEPFAVTSQ
jgi:hypothetical protein